jgi:WD40 repeat protein
VASDELTPGDLGVTLNFPETSSADAAVGPRLVGDYEIVKEIARGGMGVVFQARQKSLQRIVALKMILAGQLATEADRQRFRAEAEAAAQLDHPNIVPIYEVGEHQGLPYFSMKLVAGGTLATAHADHVAPVSSKERQRWAARVVAEVAGAVHYAHQRGILHRDLKPANILLAGPDANGTGPTVPLVTDFGLAKRTGADGGASQTGAVVGTPSYMAPEQAAGQKNITTAADVYSLGAILYELLTGRPPFQSDSVMQTLSDVVHREPTPPRRLEPGLDDDLQTICLKCLEKDPAARYPSAGDMACDLERWLAGDPIHARPAGWWKRTVKWTRRRPAAAALLAVSSMSLVGLVVFLAMLWHNAEERAAAVKDLQSAKRQLDELNREGELARTENANQKRENDQARKEGREQRYANDLQKAQAAWEAGNVGHMLALLEKHRPKQGEPDQRGFEWYYLWRLAHLHEREWFPEPHVDLKIANPKGGLRALRFALSPDGKALASVDRDKAVKVWDVDSGQLVRSMTTLADDLASFSFTSDGRALQFVTIKSTNIFDPKRGLMLGNMPPTVDPLLQCLGSKRLELDDPARLQDQSFDPKHAPSLMNLFDIGVHMSSQKLWAVIGPNKDFTIVTAFAWSPDGRTLALAGMESSISDKGVKVRSKLLLWDNETGKYRSSIESSDPFLQAVAFSPAGDTLVTAGVSGGIVVRDPQSGQERFVHKSPGGMMSYVGFSAEGKQMVTATLDGIVKVSDLSGQKLVMTVKSGMQDPVIAQLTPDEKHLIVGSAEGAVRVWNMEVLNGPRKVAGLPGEVRSIVPHADGTVTTLDGTGLVRKTDPARGKVIHNWKADSGVGVPVPPVISPAGNVIAVRDGTLQGIRLHEASTGKRLPLPPDLPETDKDLETQSLAFAPDNRRLAYARGKGETVQGITVTALSGGKTRTYTTSVKGAAGRLLFAPDNRRLFAVLGQTVVAIDLESGSETRLLEAGADVLNLAVSTQGDFLACCLPDRIQIMDLKTGREWRSLQSDTHAAAAAFSPDGRRLATAGMLDHFGRGGGVRVWDVASGLELMTLGDPTRSHTAVAFSGDGRILAVGSTPGVQLFSRQEIEGEVTLLEAAAPEK